ncbi:MAG: DUF2461 family protein, partial [Pseudomonadota bacterium]
SKDKTPLNTHLHVMWQPVDRDALAPSWFWGLSRDYFVQGMGVMGLQGDALTRYRAFVDRWGGPLTDALVAAEQAGASLSDWGPEPLKRVPKPYDADHPQAELLKRKALALSAPMPDDWRNQGLVKATLARVQDLMPVWRMFHDHL